MKIQNAEMEFVTFDVQDVIATSVPSYDKTITFSNFGNQNLADNTLKFSDGTEYTGSNIGSNLHTVGTYFEMTLLTGTKFGDIMARDIVYTNSNNSDSENKSNLNGVWTWLNDQFIKVKQ